MGRLLSATAFAAAALAFLLPFGLVTSCDGGEVRFTGSELATFSVPIDGRDTQDRILRDELESNAGPFALGLLAALFCGLVASALGESVAARLSAAVSLVLAQLLLYAIVLTADGSELFVGGWLALASTVAAALVALVSAARDRRRAGRSGWRLAAYSVAVVLPPLGAVAVVAAWLLAIGGRAVARTVAPFRPS